VPAVHVAKHSLKWLGEYGLCSDARQKKGEGKTSLYNKKRICKEKNNEYPRKRIGSYRKEYK